MPDLQKRMGELLLTCVLLLAIFTACATQVSAPTEIMEEPTEAVVIVDDATEESASAPPTEAPPTETPPAEATATEVPLTETPTALTPLVPAITIADQPLGSGTIIVAEVVSPGNYWLVIHRDENGAPGAAIGYAPLAMGVNENVAVEIDPAQATAVLHAMIHLDDGVIGDYEFPYYDLPLLADGQVVMEAFNVSGLVVATQTVATQTVATEAAATEPAAAPERVEVSIQDFQFAPGRLTVRAGTTVVWTNNGRARHTATADDGLFDSGSLSSGGVFEFTFDTPGTYAYFCRLHGGHGGQGMAGTIVVTE
jgi:plastocyanin